MALLGEMFDQFDHLHIALHLKCFLKSLESDDPKLSVPDTAGCTQRTMRKGQMLAEMFDGVIKQLKHST